MTPEEATNAGRRFHLLEIVGAGAFGEVYLAEQDSGAGFRRKVAIKLLHVEVEKIQEAGSRMRDEARILARLSHRNIVTVLDLVKLSERWAVVMDYVPGADLEEVVKALVAKGEKVPAPAALESGAAILRALDAAYHAKDDQGHELKVIHRDIKPTNVRLTTDGEIKVLDFGVARVELDGRESTTRAEGWMGTERYMAPERILCEGDTPAGDVYAAVSTVFEVLTGEPLGRTPVLDERHTPFVEARLDLVKARLADVDPALCEEIVDWIRRGLATEPGDRPDAAALADTFDGLARRLPGEGLTVFARRVVPALSDELASHRKPADGILSEVTGILDRATLGDLDEASSVLPITPQQPAPPPRKSRLPLLLGVGVGALGVTVLLGVLALGGVAAALGSLGGSLAEVDQAVKEAPDPAPEPEPEPAPAPEPEPAPVAAPEPEPEPPPAPAPSPVAARPTPRPEPAPAPSGPRIAKAQVAVADASSVRVVCGDVSTNGTASVRITDFPAGTCQVEAVYLGQTYRQDVSIDRPRGYTCAVTDGALSCR